MATLLHELWVESDQEQTLCLAGPMGDALRAQLLPGARKVWSVEGNSHFDVMTKYYEYMGWGRYSTEHAEDYKPYSEEWLQIQRSR